MNKLTQNFQKLIKTKTNIQKEEVTTNKSFKSQIVLDK